MREVGARMGDGWPPGHVYAKIAGLWCDTGAQSSSNDRDRWSTRRASPAGGFVVRHPTGY
jgi:hypothetical protein